MKAKENTTKLKRTKFDLQDRFIDYAVRIIKLSEKLSSLLLETDELISILFTSIETAKKQKER